MPDYGVTEKGFVLKRMDTILEEIHGELTEQFGFDTRLLRPSFLNVLVTTFAGQVADLWETAQDSYYAKFPATATGLNLDNAVQYGGIRRMPNKRTCYPLHCKGEDGTVIPENAVVSTDTRPEIRLYCPDEFIITREKFNAVAVKVAVTQTAAYSITINGNQYSYSSADGDEGGILEGLMDSINDDGYEVYIEKNQLVIEDSILTRNNTLILSNNLTTASVTTVGNFLTEEYGKVALPDGIVTRIVKNVTGLMSVTNLIEPVYGRLVETDIELRQSYLAKSALRSNTMIESIVGELLNNVPDVISASGYENDTDLTDGFGRPPHSVEIVVEGGNNIEIAEAILRKKAGGIQTFGSVTVNIPGKYGDSIPISFNRPESLYTWIKVILSGEKNQLPDNYIPLTIDSILKYSTQLISGVSLLAQMLNEGIYDTVSGVTYIRIYTAYSSDKAWVPQESDYVEQNIMVTTRQKVAIDEARIEVKFNEDS